MNPPPPPPLPPQIHRLTRVTSTLDVLHEYASRGAPHGTVVVADEQLEGRGTRGRTWYSSPGGLWYSILYRDGHEAAVEVLSLRIGLTLARVIESVVPEVRLGLKWPNDLMLSDRKLGGVLCEARWQGASLGWIAVGIGINISNPIPPGLETSAGSLDSVRKGLTAEQLIAPLTNALRTLPLSSAVLSAAELGELQGRDWLQGKQLAEPVPGIARGIQADGSLRVERPDGVTLPVRAGHILLV